MSIKDTEREHCEAVGAAEANWHQGDSAMEPCEWRAISEHLTDLIARERAAAREQGRAEALADLAQLTEDEGFKHTPAVLRLLASWLESRALATKTGGSND